MLMKRAVRELKTLRRLLYSSIFNRGIYSPELRDGIADQFHKLYYNAQVFDGTWNDTRWLGVQTAKCPLDLWIYQEIMHEVRPDVIVECGTAYGGSALFFASICDLLGNGTVISIDIKERPGRPEHGRIRYLLGSSTSDEIIDEVKKRIGSPIETKVMIVLDSDHRKSHVLNELRRYSKLVTVGSYLIVEDTNLNGHPVDPTFGPGPMEAVEEFLAGHDDFVVDKKREKFYLTFNPRGYLQRIR